MGTASLLPFLLLAALVLEPFTDASGFVVDENGAAISKAHVIYHRDLAGQMDAQRTEDRGVSDGTLITDKFGKFSARVHPGLYDVCVMVDGFTPQCRKVEVTPKDSGFPTFHLKADPLVTKKIGDTFGKPPVTPPK